MKPVIIFNILIAGIFILTGTVFAQMAVPNAGQGDTAVAQGVRNVEIDEILRGIYSEQKIGNIDQFDCRDVTNEQFEELGDAYMGIMLPSEQQHEVMDNMMGGEGSAVLRQAYINMGKAYLGCWSYYNSGSVYAPMIGRMMNGAGMMGWWQLYGMGSGCQPWSGWVTKILIWILLLLGIAVAVKWLKRK